jgi:hypothetical protein
MPRANYFAPGQDAPAVETAAVVPNNSSDLPVTCRALWVGTAGDVALMADGDAVAVTIKNVANGTLVPIRTRRVMATGTTATDIVALY